MITGTNHFFSHSDAERYYSGYGYNDINLVVYNKIKDGEITIGPPQIKKGEKLLTNNDEGRYFIQS